MEKQKKRKIQLKNNEDEEASVPKQKKIFDIKIPGNSMSKEAECDTMWCDAIYKWNAK